jgi:hypothetical protein
MLDPDVLDGVDPVTQGGHKFPQQILLADLRPNEEHLLPTKNCTELDRVRIDQPYA